MSTRECNHHNSGITGSEERVLVEYAPRPRSKTCAAIRESGVWVGLDSGSQPHHLRLQYPGAKRLGGISRMGEDMVALRHRKKRLEYCPHSLVNLEGTFGARRFSPRLITREP
jgi:hypothetical protein